MNRNTNTGGRVVPQANNSSGGGFSRIIQAGIGAFTQVRADEAAQKKAYEAEVIKSAGHATRLDSTREHMNQVMQDVDVKNKGIKEGGGLRFTSMSPSGGFELEKTGNAGKAVDEKAIRRKAKADAKLEFERKAAKAAKANAGGAGNATTATGTPENTATAGTPKPKRTRKAAGAAGVAVDGEGTGTVIGKDGALPPKKPKKTAAKKMSTGGGLTEIRNSDIETGSRSKK